MNVDNFLKRMDKFYDKHLLSLSNNTFCLNILNDLELPIDEIFSETDIKRYSINSVLSYESIFLDGKAILNKGFETLFKALTAYRITRLVKNISETGIFIESIYNFAISGSSEELMSKMYNRFVELRNSNFAIAYMAIKTVSDIIFKNMPYFANVLADADRTGVIKYIMENDKIMSNLAFSEKHAIISSYLPIIFDPNIIGEHIINTILSSYMIDILHNINEHIVVKVDEDKIIDKLPHKLESIMENVGSTQVDDILDDVYTSVISNIKKNPNFIKYVKQVASSTYDMLKMMDEIKDDTKIDDMASKFRDSIMSISNESKIDKDTAKRLLNTVLYNNDKDDNINFDDEL